MHIQDGVLSPAVCAAAGAVSLGAVGYSLHRMRDSLDDRTIPMTGMVSALVFAGQMVNFPLGVPVSGHLMGGVLAATVLGPWAGCVAIAIVLLVQCVLFADGGLMALGANVLHMAVIGAWGGYAVSTLVRRSLGGGNRGIIAGAVVASWLTVMAAAALFCVEFYAWRFTAGPAAADLNFRTLTTLMVTFHSMIGVGEALITGSVIAFVLRHRPDVITPEDTLSDPSRQMRPLGRFLTAGVVASLAVAAFLAPLASGWPDGLEAVATRLGFDALASVTPLVLDDYAVPGVAERWESLAVSLAGIGGTLAVLVLAFGLGRTLKPRPAVARVAEP